MQRRLGSSVVSLTPHNTGDCTGVSQEELDDNDQSKR